MGVFTKVLVHKNRKLLHHTLCRSMTVHKPRRIIHKAKYPWLGFLSICLLLIAFLHNVRAKIVNSKTKNIYQTTLVKKDLWNDLLKYFKHCITSMQCLRNSCHLSNYICNSVSKNQGRVSSLYFPAALSLSINRWRCTTSAFPFPYTNAQLMTCTLYHR